MKKNLLLLFLVIMLVPTVISCHQKKTKTIHIGWDWEYVPTERKLSRADFEEIELGSSFDDIAEKFGEPDVWIGSGILNPAYVLEDGTAIVCFFDGNYATGLRMLVWYDGHGHEETIKEYPNKETRPDGTQRGETIEKKTGSVWLDIISKTGLVILCVVIGFLILVCVIKAKRIWSKIGQNKRRMIENGLLLFIVAAYLVSGVFYISKNKNYIKCDKTEKYHEYFQVYNYYDKTIAEKGQPEKEFMAEVKFREYTLHSWLVYYEGLILDFDYDEETHRGRRLFNFQIMDDRYSLGWQKVRVGDVRSRIERIFRYSRSVLKENVPIFDEEGNVTYEAVTFYYSDNFNWGYGFVYDEQDEVKTILVRPLGM